MAPECGEEPALLGIFTTDTHLIVRTWDPFLVRITGIATADALGNPIGTLLPGLEERGLLALFRDVCANGTIEVLSPALHRGLVDCPPVVVSSTSTRMIQRVTIGPVREEQHIAGVAVTVEDVTAEREKAVAQLPGLADPNWRPGSRRCATFPAGDRSLSTRSCGHCASSTIISASSAASSICWPPQRSISSGP